MSNSKDDARVNICRRQPLTFDGRAHHLPISGADEVLPSGRYQVVAEQEPIEGLSFAAWQRVRTLLFLPADSPPGKAREVVPVDPNELEAAQAADALEGPQMSKPRFVWKDWLVPPVLFPLFLATMIVAYALLRAPT